MSTEQQVDAGLIEETKQQIRDLVSEIAQLAKSDIAPQDFYDAFLNRVVTALAAEGGAIWTTGDGNRIELSYQINLVKTRLAEDEASQQKHGRLLGRVLQTAEPMLVAPHSGAGDDEETLGANPTEFLLLLAPLLADQEIKGVVEVFQRPGARPTTQKGYMRFVLQMCELAGDYLKTRSLRHFTDRQSLWSQLETFTRLVHKGLDPRETAFTIANEGRRLIQCDRVSVAIRNGRKCKIESVSGQDTFDKRSNTIRLLGRLATAVANSGEPMWYTGDTTNMAPQVEDAVQEYVDESHSKTVGVLPIFKPEKDESDNPDEREPPEVLGALIVEQIEDARLKDGMLQRVDVVNAHSSSALSNSLEHNNLFLMPVWRTLGKATWVVKARTLPKTLAITGAILAVIVALCVVPADFEMEGRGTLEPVSRVNIYPPETGGVVKEILIPGFAEHERSGTPLMVKEGDPLLRLENKALDKQLTEVQTRLKENQERQKSLQNQEQATRNVLEQNRIRNEIASLRAVEILLLKEQRIVAQMREDLVIHSPMDGQILTWDLRNRLIFRQVEPGQVLMTIADPGNEWRIEVEVPEGKIGPVTEAWKKVQQEQDQGKDAKLPVTYLLLSEPDHSYPGHVTHVGDRADMTDQKGSSVSVWIAMEKDRPQDPRAGSTVRARVYCGKRAIGYVYLRDLFQWVNREVFFPLGL